MRATWTSTSVVTALLLLGLAGGLVFPFLGWPAPADAATHARLQQARWGVTAERTRLVLEFSDAQFRYEVIARTDTSIVVRCDRATLAQTLERERPGEGLARRLRLEPGAAGQFLLTLSCREAAAARLFRLEAEGRVPPRLVIDLVPTASAESVPPSAEPVESPVIPAPAKSSAPPPAVSDRAPKQDRVHVVVLDPGHGGKDPGATAKGLQEKEVCLDVARRAAEILNRAPNYRAYPTRSDDRFIPLGERMRFAERKDADLFVSIHVNAAKSRQASGAEVFFLSIGAASDRASSELARLENEADPDYVVAEDEELRGLPFAVDLRQSDTMMRSSRIAEVVLDLFSARKLAEPRGVKQAGFAVLKSFQVPSILVELGFISSPTDRKKLQTKEHRAQLAEALAAGVREYFDKFAPARDAEAATGAAGR